MSTLRALRSLSFIALCVPAFAACGDDEVKPGNLVANWAHAGPTATCGSRGVTNVEARLYSGTEEVVSGSAACVADARTGTVALPNIKPGTYRLVTEATDASGKGLYLGEIARQNVAEAKTTESAPITLSPKPGRLMVDWLVPGQKCSSSDIVQVEIVLYYNAGTNANEIGRQKVGCDNVFKSPDDGANRAGVLFAGLEANNDVILQGFGYDSADKKIAQATSEGFAITLGDEREPILDLQLCAGGTCD